MANGPSLTIEVVREMLRKLDEAQMDTELDLFLSDHWNFYQILKAGGTIVEYNGLYYAIALPPLASPIPHAFAWDGPDSPFRR